MTATRFNALLAFIAGYVDVVGFVALGGLFTAHVTGNFVMIGAAAVGKGLGGVITKLLALPTFMVTVALTRSVVLALLARGHSGHRPLLLVQASLLAAFLLLGLAAEPVINPDALLPMLAGLAGVMAMAVQNAGARLLLSDQPPSTVMTGTTTQIVIDLVDLTRVTGEARQVPVKRLQRMVPSLLGFAVGALSGGVGFVVGGFYALVTPIVILGWLAASSPVPTPSAKA